MPDLGADPSQFAASDSESTASANVRRFRIWYGFPSALIGILLACGAIFVGLQPNDTSLAVGGGISWYVETVAAAMLTMSVLFTRRILAISAISFILLCIVLTEFAAYHYVNHALGGLATVFAEPVNPGTFVGLALAAWLLGGTIWGAAIAIRQRQPAGSRPPPG